MSWHDAANFPDQNTYQPVDQQWGYPHEQQWTYETPVSYAKQAWVAAIAFGVLVLCAALTLVSLFMIQADIHDTLTVIEAQIKNLGSMFGNR